MVRQTELNLRLIVHRRAVPEEEVVAVAEVEVEVVARCLALLFSHDCIVAKTDNAANATTKQE